jgi:GNAT superfamily N-acetyltransferase
MKIKYVRQQMLRSQISSLVERLLHFDIKAPILWCPISAGGKEILNIIAMTLKRKRGCALLKNSSFISVDVSDDSVIFYGSNDLKRDINHNCVILLDLVINSGYAFKQVTDEVSKYHPYAIITYAPFVRNNTVFVPSIFESVIGEKDRIVLEGASKASTFLTNTNHIGVSLKRLTSKDLKSRKISCGVKSMDKITWADRFYDMVNSTESRVTYLLINHEVIVGYLTCHLHRSDCMMLDEIAVSKKYLGMGYGGVLMKWLDIYSRSKDCVSIVLWSIHEQIPFYKKAGYKLIPGESMSLDGETYFLMLARLVYEPQGFMVGWLP